MPIIVSSCYLVSTMTATKEHSMAEQKAVMVDLEHEDPIEHTAAGIVEPDHEATPEHTATAGTSDDTALREGDPLKEQHTTAAGTLALDHEQLEDPTTTIAAILMERIARTGGTSFYHILFFNSLRKTGSAKDGILTFIDIHANLMTLHGFMAGFQFVALESGGLDGSESTTTTTLEKTIFTLRVIGFGMSLAGTLISLITIEFLKSIVEERPEFQVEGAIRYGRFFLWSDWLGIQAALALAVTVNAVLHTKDLPQALSYVMNGISVVVVVALLYQFKIIILDRQLYGPGRLYYCYLDRLRRRE